nr:carboxymuconolactone decarboxylase family protein [Gammaproteobacteria bacterium]
MTHIKQLAREDLPELEPIMGMVEQAMGFVPNSFLTMAHWPEMLHSFSKMDGTIINYGE